MTKVRQQFARQRVADLPGAVEQALRQLRLAERIRPSDKVAIPVGSRGIKQIPLIIATVVNHVRRLGADPFVVAAMGSHGGGTEHGQREILGSLGVTEKSVGAPIIATTNGILLNTMADGLPAYCDPCLLQCNAILLVNRVKPHTSFHGSLESGLVKMLVVGCGKQDGAKLFHSFGSASLAARLRSTGQHLLAKLPVVGGVAIVENAYKETAVVEALDKQEIIEGEERLLQMAKAMLPRLPISQLHLLVVDRMGKEIAGTGMDTNVIGRMGIRGVPDGEPHIDRIAVLDLSAASHGNANGMGLADFITRRFADQINFETTYLNTLTATFVDRAKMPVVLASDREVVQTALRTVGNPTAPRIIRIASTLELEHIAVSEAVLAELAGVVVESGPERWYFDLDGNLL